MSNRATVLLLLASCAALAALNAQAAQWQPLGQMYVDFRSDPTVIPASSGSTLFSNLKIEVKDHPLEIENVRVFLASGKSFDVKLNAYVAPGRTTKEIAIPGGPAVVERAQVTYKNATPTEERMPLVRLLGES